MKKYLASIILALTLGGVALAGLPPTTSKVNGDTSNVTTFNYQFPQMNASRTGVTSSITMPNFVGDSGTGGNAGLVPSPSPYSFASGDFLSAGGNFSFVDQSKTINPSFSLVTKDTNITSGVIKFENTQIFTSTTTGKQYAASTGFNGSPTLTIFDISDQTNPIQVGTYSNTGAYNVTFGVVSGVQYAFIGLNSGSKLIVLNLTNPYSPTQTSSTVITGSPGSIYGVSFLNGYVYCATQSTGLVVMDVGGGTGTPAAPVQTYQQGGGIKSFGVVATGTNVYTTSFSTSPYATHAIISWTLAGAGSPSAPSVLQTLTVPTVAEALGLSVNGNTAFVSVSTGNLTLNAIDLVDITTPGSMSNLSQIVIAGTNGLATAMTAVGNGNYVYVPSGLNSTYGGAIDVYDITNRSSPVHLSQVTTGVASEIFGGIALSGGYIFAANYGTTGSNGSFNVFTQIESAPIIGTGTASQLTITNSLSFPNLTATKPLYLNSSNLLAEGSFSGNTTTFATASGTLTSGHCVDIDSNGNFIDAGAACGTGAGTVSSVGLSLPSIFTVSGSPVTTSGTLTGSLNAQAANTVFAGGPSASATPTFRSLVGADLPNPSASTLGGIESITSVTHKWINSISTSGVPSLTQPDYSDLTGTPTPIPNTVPNGLTGATSFTAGAPLFGNGTSAISSGTTSGITTEVATVAGTLTHGDCIQANSDGDLVDSGAPCGSGGGGVTSVAATVPSFFTVTGSPITTSGTLAITANAQAQNTFLAALPTASSTPAFRLLVGSDLPNPSASTLGGVQSIASVSHNFLNSISTSGVPSQSQPAFTDLSGNIATSQINSGTGATSATFLRGDGTWASVPLSYTTGSPTVWSGYHLNSNQWSTSSTSFVVPSNATGVSLVQTANSNFGTVTTASGNIPGITFTPTKLGYLYVCAIVEGYVNANNVGATYELTDSSSTVIAFGKTISLSSNPQQIPLCGVYNVTSLTATTLEIQIKNSLSAGTAYLTSTSSTDAAIQWSVIDTNPPIMGNVVSQYPGTERQDRVLVNANCTSSPCTITNQSSNSTVTRTGTGSYTLNFTTTWGGIPTCTCTAISTTQNAWCQGVAAISTSAFTFQTYTSTGAVDAGFSIICDGQQ